MIYFLFFPRKGQVKIGTTNNHKQRFWRLRWEHGELELLGVMPGSYEKEAEILERFDEHRVWNGRYAPEWFWFNGDILSFVWNHAFYAPSEINEKKLRNHRPKIPTVKRRRL